MGRKLDSLIIHDDVGQPYIFGGHVQHLDAAVLLRVPAQLVIEPFLRAATTGAVNYYLHLPGAQPRAGHESLAAYNSRTAPPPRVLYRCAREM